MPLNMKISPFWASGKLPPGIESLGKRESATYRSRVANLTDILADDTYESLWPKPGLSVLAIQDGFVQADKNSDKMDAVFEKLSPSGVVCWPVDGPGEACFRAQYGQDLRLWIEMGIVVSPVVVIAIDVELILIVDDLLVFTLIAGESDIISQVASIFGDSDQMRASFSESLDDYYPDADDELGNWIRDNVDKSCSW